MKNWLSQPEHSGLNQSISFMLKLDKFDVYVRFPHEYPKVKCAEIRVRSNELGRDEQSRLNNELQAYVEHIFEPDCSMTTEVIAWLHEHTEDFFKSTTKANSR